MTAPVRWLAAASTDELWEGDVLDVEVADEQVLLVHLEGGTIKAYQGMCPHQEVLLADGKWDPDTGRLVCPGHNWEFDLSTGTGVNPAGCRLYEYGVQVVSDEIRVAVPQDGERHHLRYQQQ
jgi:toluene monooxygenase system ferredoxin subunit